MTYSPGPWRVGDAGHTVFGPPNGTPSPETIATCLKFSNTKVIAKVPALIEALQWALDQIEDDLDPGHQAAFGSAKNILAQAKEA